MHTRRYARAVINYGLMYHNTYLELSPTPVSNVRLEVESNSAAAAAVGM